MPDKIVDHRRRVLAARRSIPNTYSARVARQLPGKAPRVTASFADPPPVQAAWRALFLAERVVGVRAVRLMACTALRLSGRFPAGYAKTLRRVSARVREDNPRLVKVPRRWSDSHPSVRVRRRGLTFDLDLRDNLQATLFYAGVYEPNFSQDLLARLRPGDVVVDVGAHIGVHALQAARRLRQIGGGRVTAFEPASDSADTLRAAARRNNLDVEVVQAACSDRSGRLTLYADDRYPAQDAGVRSVHGDGPAVENVVAVRFDDWAEQRQLSRLDVVKVDIEGHEALALTGMCGSLMSLRPRALYVEVKDDSLGRAPISDDALRRLIADLGYVSSGRTFDHNELFVPRSSGTA